MESSKPSESAFWADHIRPLETSCAICLEPFTSTHPAIQFTGATACRHIFGESCLREWSETVSRNANTCPVCRRVLWKSDDPNDITNAADETNDDDVDADDFLDGLEDDPEEDLAHLVAELERANREFDSVSATEFDFDAEELLDELGYLDAKGILAMGREYDLYDTDQLPDRLQALVRTTESLESALRIDDNARRGLHYADDVQTATISLAECDRATIDELVEDLFCATEPGHFIPRDADLPLIKMRMEYRIGIVLEVAGYRSPFLVALGPVDGMLWQFQGMVNYRRNYVVSNAYIRWWKDVMVALIMAS